MNADSHTSFIANITTMCENPRLPAFFIRYNQFYLNRLTIVAAIVAIDENEVA